MYQEFIQNIIDTRGQWTTPEDGYYEMHHIIPKCLGGDGDYKNGTFKKCSNHNNCIWLTRTEHLIAHKLLAEEYPDNAKIQFALVIMGNNTEVNSLAHMGENNGMYGKHHTEETKKKMHDSAIGKKKTAEHAQHISEGRKGIKFSEEHCKHLSESKKGCVSNRKGCTLSEETKLKISNSLKKYYKGED